MNPESAGIGIKGLATLAFTIALLGFVTIPGSLWLYDLALNPKKALKKIFSGGIFKL